MKNRFVGTWRLVSVEDQAAGGEITYPYGERPAGLLVYDDAGHMAVQIMRRDRAHLSSSDWQQADAEEVKAAVAGFTAFFGSYEVNEEEATVVHSVEGHLLPASVGKNLKRTFEFSGDRLILKPTPSRRIIWERVKE